jgi:protein-S-isoprenylcysteine O-methyltransferase Ste14
MLAGLLIVGCLPRSFPLGELLIIIGLVSIYFFRRPLSQEVTPLPLRKRAAIQLIALGVLAIAVTASLQFPENSSLRFWSGTMIVWIAIGFVFWLLVRRRKSAKNK